MELIIIILVMIGLLWFMSNRGKKQQAAQREKLYEQLTPGTWVMTGSGFFGKIVEVDGEVVTLEAPGGEESLWLNRAIAEVKEPPFAQDDDEDESFAADDEEPAEAAGGATLPEDPTLRPGGPTVTDDGRLSDDDKR